MLHFFSQKSNSTSIALVFCNILQYKKVTKSLKMVHSLAFYRPNFFRTQTRELMYVAKMLPGGLNRFKYVSGLIHGSLVLEKKSIYACLIFQLISFWQPLEWGWVGVLNILRFKDVFNAEFYTKRCQRKFQL